jgi:hypothetical protein
LGCDSKYYAEPPSLDKVGELVKGTHPLRKLSTNSKTTGKISGDWFLFFGGLNGEMNTTTIVRFAWMLKDSSYCISSLPIDKIRIKFGYNETPTIKFRWESWSLELPTQEIMDKHIFYAVITCREEDWPKDITLPLNKEDINEN